jgi:hypothetical protein
MYYLTGFSFAVFIIYTIYSIIKNDIPESLSATYYLWPKWVFPTLMTFSAFTLLPGWLEITEGENGQFLSFLSCAGLIAIGFVPDYKNDLGQFKIHIICAYLAVATALISLTFVTNYWWLFPGWLVMNYLFNIDNFKKNYVFHIEEALIGATYMNVLFNL